MHECPICNEDCGCDGEDCEMLLMDPQDCTHQCEQQDEEGEGEELC